MSRSYSIRRMPTWLSVLWIGVIASVIAWGLAWLVGRGPSVVPLIWSIGAIVLAWRASLGSRWALLILAFVGALTLLVAALYVGLVMSLTLGQQPVLEWLPIAAFPVVAAAVLTIGAVWGLRVRI
jgi:hypothetical protein